MWGLAHIQSIGGWNYYVSFLDDAKQLSTILFLKRKNNAIKWIQEYGAVIEQKFGKQPRYLCFNNGKELVNAKIQKWASEKRITIKITALYSPSQNGIAE